MELKVGMYARLHGKIGEITHICMCEQCKLRGFYEPVVNFGHGDSDYISIYWKDDLKASHNIIDLIEVGDIVVSLNASNILEYNLLTLSNIDELKDLWEIQGNIKSIVTKEQFESISYKVKE